MTTPVYDYAVLGVEKVVDGDTVDLRLDLGFYATMLFRFRVYDVDTPERREVDWAEATNFTREWLARQTALRVKTFKLKPSTPVADAVHGRWAGLIYNPVSGEVLAEALKKWMAQR